MGAAVTLYVAFSVLAMMNVITGPWAVLGKVVTLQIAKEETGKIKKIKKDEER